MNFRKVRNRNESNRTGSFLICPVMCCARRKIRPAYLLHCVPNLLRPARCATICRRRLTLKQHTAYIYIYVYIHIHTHTDKPLQSAPQHSLSLLSFFLFARTGSQSSPDVVRARDHLQMSLDPWEEFHWQSDRVPSTGPLYPQVPVLRSLVNQIVTRTAL